MCGIIGTFSLNGFEAEPVDAVRAGMARMALRGPDGEGLFVGPGVTLGHRRLAVIDIEGGKQPFHDAGTGATLVFNGEIYNYRELREELRQAGCAFTTASDTEVLLRACLQWGPDCLDRLSGIYAFAVYEPSRKRLLLARDRLGVKPLFYAVRNRRVAFASSMAALRCLPFVGGTLDLPAASHYLTTLRTTLGRRTLVKDVCTLLPGEYLLAEHGWVEPEIRRYWDFPVLAPDDKPNPGLEVAADRARELMTQSVREQLISDVPLGGFLSGGIDSSVIAAMAGKLSGGNFDAYSVGYDLEGYNEWPYVREASVFHHMKCREIHLEPLDYPEVWKFLIEQKGLPVSTPNEIPIYHLARALKKDFTVALSGEGADEIFGGYVVPYFSSFDYDRARRQAPAFGEPLTPQDRAIRRLYRRPYLFCLADQYFFLNSWVPFAQKQSLLTTDALQALDGDDLMCSYYEDLFERLKCCSTFDTYLHVHARVNLEGLLFREDSSTMAASVEARVPFTDHRVVEYLFTLPDHYKMDWTGESAALRGRDLNANEIDRENLVTSKILLRRAFARDVPKSILERRKMSFPVPVREWFSGFLNAPARKMIGDSALAGAVLNRTTLDRLLETPDLPASGMALWPVTNLCLWQQTAGIDPP
jgi:asparagine synthase (glutamine-hydrolysing)